ncbi:MAG TPA: DUF4405 domain-containing protein [Bradyrhizobium sp.]|nr:DUF4405 domain-containing protein [Bradyrhizobium sp.]
MHARTLATPVTIGAFLAIGLTGIALFFHIEPRVVHEAHEWIGLFFVLAALWHVVTNWRSLLVYLKRRPSIAAFTLVIVAAVGLIGATGSFSPDNGGPRAVLDALSRQPLAHVAGAFGLTEQQAAAALNAEGIAVADGQSLGDAARAAHQPANFALGILARTRPLSGQ